MKHNPALLRNRTSVDLLLPLWGILLAALLLAPAPAPAGLLDQWRADDLNLLNDGDAVGSWSSASNRTASGSVGAQPLLKKNATPAGGSVVRFNQTVLTANDNPLNGATAFSIAIVFKASVVGAGGDANPWYQCTGLVDAENPSIVNDWGTVFNGAGHVGLGTGNPDTTTYSTGTSLVDNNFHIAVFTWGGGSQSVYVDSQPAVTQSRDTSVARMTTSFVFGGIRTLEGGATRQFVGDFAEVRFYDTSLSVTEVTNLIQQLTEQHIIGKLPVIRSFVASTNQILIGSPVTLSWNVKTNSDLIVIDNGVGVVTGFTNSVTVAPRTNTTYTLTTSNVFGIRTAQVTVLVDQGIPVANNRTVDTPQNTPVAITLTGSDPQGSNLTFAVVSSPYHGTLSGTPPNLTYTPAADYFGNDQFTFQVNDGEFDSRPGIVTVRVLPPPTPPSGFVLSTTNISVGAGPGTFIALLRAIDVNPDDTHTFTLVPGFGDNAQFAITGNQLQAGPAFSGGLGATFTIRIRVTDSTGLFVEQNRSLAVTAVSQSVVINEILYNSDDNTIREEFIELHNPAPVDVDVSFWRLAGGVDYAMLSGTVIPAGGFLIIAQDPPTIQARYGQTALGPWSGQLNNDGDRVTLLDAAGKTVDEVNYSSEFPWPIGANGGGSMALANPSLDNDLGSSWRTETPPSPGRTNHVFVTNAPPNIRQVRHSPKSPDTTNQVVITAKVTDPDGVASVQLAYQIVTPGNYISSITPLTVSQLNALYVTPMEPASNPAFENPANWITVPMVDSGTGGDEVAGDNIYTAVLPPQANRVLVRYRIIVTDLLGASRRAPFEDDPSLNFAYYVYNGVPAYAGASSEALQTLPVYFLLTRAQDFDTCAAYNSADQLKQFLNEINASWPNIANEGRFAFNWEGAFVYDGEVYDHVRYRTQGANGRYQPGRRSFSIQYNDGRFLAAKDLDGQPYPRKWSRLNIAKGQSNRQTVTFSLNEVTSYFLWNKIGVPSPLTHHIHWRVVRGAQEQPDLFTGDFYGIFMVQENYDVRFLETHDLPKGNLYKLINAARSTSPYIDMQKQQRYQGAFAVTNGADAVNVQNKLTAPNAVHDTPSLLAYVNYPKWYLYHAICETVRDYDFWPSANKNAGWYFEPAYGASNNFYGRLWTLPWDATDTWGSTWNGGQDLCYNGIFPVTAYAGGDAGQNLELQVEYFNTIRQVRDLLIQPDQVIPFIDAYAARLAAVIPADLARWASALPAGANYQSLQYPGPGLTGGLAGYVQDMKNFLFVGGNNTWWIDRQSINAGGWAVMRLDQLATNDTAIPSKPVITYIGLTNSPAEGLVFQSSAFADPQGAGTFGAIQWRIAEITPTNTPVAGPGQLKWEWDAAWDSGELTAFTNRIVVPAVSVAPGKVYRARVRHKDNTGRWSRWSDPAQFVPPPFDIVHELQQSLVISEIMYHPPDQGTIDGDDFEFLELKNIGSVTLDLSGLTFTAGINFTFTNGTRLAPGQSFVLGRNAARLQSQYPGLVVNGIYTGKLDNAGETITLTHPYGVTILSVTYGDRAPWPVAADGYGFSLVWDPASPTGYRASSQPGGSPGADDPAPVIPPVVINEILSSAVLPALDAIELYNPTATNADIGGWFLTDDAGYPWKYRIADGTVLPPGCYVTFDEAQFNPTPGVGASFGLSSFGEQVYLFSGNAAHELTGYSHGFSFGGAAPGVSFGRYINAGGEELFPPQLATTLGTNNAGPKVGPVVFNEIQYHPDAAGDEFIELLNASGTPVPLFDPANPTNAWKLGGLNYTFPANLTLAPGELLLLTGSDPDAFRAKYGVPESVRILGPVPGTLQNDGERLELQSPAPPTTNGVVYFATDEVRYSDRAPWPAAADGHGPSLQRLASATYGSESANWVAATPTPGRLYPGGEAPVITRQPVSLSACETWSVSFEVEVSGAGPFIYQWLFNGNNLTTTTNGTLVITNLQLSHQGYYSVAVWGAAGSAVSSNVWLSVLPVPRFFQAPQSTNVTVGGNATFTVTAAGNGPLTYQWRLNGADLVGATNSTLTVTNVQLAKEGNYQVLVRDSVGQVLSPGAYLMPLSPITYTQSPQNQTNVVGATVSFSAAIVGYPPPFTFEFRKVSTPLTSIITYQSNCTFTLTNIQYSDAGQYRIVASNLATASAMKAANLTVLSAPIIVNQPSNQWANPGGSASFVVKVIGTANFSYQWYFNGTNPVGPTILNTNYATNTLVLTNVQGANLGNYLVVVTNRYGAVTSEVASLSFRSPPVIVSQPADQTVVAGTDASFNVVADGGGPYGYRWYRNGTNAVTAWTGNPSLVISNAQAANAGTYWVAVTNGMGSATSEVATLTVLLPPNIVAQPTNLTVVAGSNATFSVVASGTEPLSYRWRFNETNILAGETNPALALLNVQLASAGDYSVEVSNPYGAVTSAVARLTVLSPPILLAPPTNQTVAAGATATFAVVADGTAPLRYQWYFNETNRLAGATNASLALTNIQPADAGTYAVVVTNVLGSVTSAPVTLTVSGFVDHDGDGLPDDWELAHGLDPNDPTDANEDADGDGMLNWQEYVASTDPADALSVLKIEAASWSDGANLSFFAISNKTYTVQFTESLGTGAWSDLANIAARTTNRLETIYDPQPTTNRFYRVMTPQRQ